MTPVSSQSDKHCPSYELQSYHKFWGSYHNREPLRPKNSEHLPGTILTGTSFNWRLIIPTKLALLRTGFGQPSLAHSFHQEECFETILLEIIKSGHSNPCDTLDLLFLISFACTPCLGSNASFRLCAAAPCSDQFWERMQLFIVVVRDICML
jgi:hypothetical protein